MNHRMVDLRDTGEKILDYLIYFLICGVTVLLPLVFSRSTTDQFLAPKEYFAHIASGVILFFFPQAMEHPIPEAKLNILTDFFNQQRDLSRSKIKVLPFNLIKDLSRCQGEFLHDVAMLSQEPPPKERKPLF